MKTHLPGSFEISPEVARALSSQSPVVALETTVITHGLPEPENLRLAAEVEEIVKNNGALPATVGLLEGKIIVGMTTASLESLVKQKDPVKVSSRNLGICIAQKLSGGTTVAGTLVVCRTTGIQVFATGGIGGVHRESNFDISADLDELARSPVIVVCAGAKAILDLPATLEALETRGVPVIGYRTNEFPAFYSINSGLPVDIPVNSPAEIAAIARSHWELGLQSAILVCVPPPSEVALDAGEVKIVLEEALHQAKVGGISRGRVTPYLLEKMKVLTHGKSLHTNLALLRNNASLAAEIAVQLSGKSKTVNF
jgi:pseudouridine-5'-phosphate glycosidase